MPALKRWIAEQSSRRNPTVNYLEYRTSDPRITLKDMTDGYLTHEE
jgi:hypothetical protein